MKKLLVLSSERLNKANQAMEEEKTSHKKMDPEAENGWSDGFYENGAGEGHCVWYVPSVEGVMW